MSVKDKADAIDRFVRTLKAGGLYDDIKAACIMAGWTNLAGALYPLKGAAPTNSGFLDADLDAGIGLKGNGSSKYLNSNRANNEDNYRDRHATTYCSDALSAATNDYRLGATSLSCTLYHTVSGTQFLGRDGTSIYYKDGSDKSAGFVGTSRPDYTGTTFRLDGETVFQAGSNSVGGDAYPYGIFCRNSTGTFQDFGPYTLSWYSFGSATDLAALDSAVSTLMSDLRSIDEQGFDPSALAYIRAVEAADGSFLETGVKKAINRFIVGCKKDGIWNSIKASCIMCGARTLAGALVPLAGTAPTPYNFVAGDYNRETGLVGDGSTKYLDSNRANNADGQDDSHLAIYKSDTTSAANPYFIGDFSAGSLSVVGQNGIYLRSADFFAGGGFASSSVGLHAASRQNASTVTFKRPGFTVQSAAKASVPIPSALNAFVFAGNSAGSPSQLSTSRLAFYSIGTSVDLSLLDARVSTLVSQIAAAIP